MKGPSCVTELPCFDVIRGMAVNYMHQAVLGVGRQLLKLWFLSKYHGCSWYIGRKIQEVDVKLMSVCPTIKVGRLPRRIYDTLKYWKGLAVIVPVIISLFKILGVAKYPFCI